MEIDQQNRVGVAEGLAILLADTYTLYLKTHNYHWNVTGPLFQSLHTMFEVQYNELALAVDEIAERIRTLGMKAPGSYKEFLELGNIPEDDATPKKAEEMLDILIRDHQTVVRTAKHAFHLAESVEDQATLDLLTRRIDIHEKTEWMLRSMTE